jgi:hypothetical protein
MDYAGAVSTDRGRCFRHIYDPYDEPDRCNGPVIPTGWLEVGGAWYFVDSWPDTRQRQPDGVLVVTH